jgi:hypothetical protein
MKTVLVAEAVRNFSVVLESLENEQEEILLVRNDHPVTRLVPEPESMDALSVFGDLHGTLDDETASEMLSGIEASLSKSNIMLNQIRKPRDY